MKKYFLNKMSTGKRLAKRSIIGTRVCAPGADGIWYSGTIQTVKTNQKDNTNCINLTPNTRYSVRFDSKLDVGKRGLAREFRESELIGPGFKTIMDVRLKPGQKVFLTYNGRESAGEVLQHDDLKDEVTVKIVPVGQEAPIELTKRLEEVRLLESRRSPRLADQEKDTDFARLADMAGDRRRQSHSIDVPFSLTQQNGSRKRRPSYSQDDREYYSINDDDPMDECNAALVLMSLSCSPNSSGTGWEPILGTSSGSSSTSWSTGSTTPPLSEDGHSTSPNSNASSTSSSVSSSTSSGIHSNGSSPPGNSNNNNVATVNNNNNSNSHNANNTNTANANGTTNDIVIRGPRTTSISTSDEGIGMDYNEDMPRKRRASQPIYKCTWKGCGVIYTSCSEVTAHVRNAHLGPRKPDEDSDEEDFFFTEIEDESDSGLSAPHPPSPPTLSHRDMARPPHEDPEYQRQLVGTYRQGLLSMSSQQQSALQAHPHLQHYGQQMQQQQHQQQLGAAIKPPLPGHQAAAAVQLHLHQQQHSLNNNNNNSISSNSSSNNNAISSQHTPGSNGSSNGGGSSSSSSGAILAHSNTSPLIHHNYTWSQVSPTSPQKHVRLSPRPSYPYPSPNYSNQIAQQHHYQQQQQLSQIQLSPGGTNYHQQSALGGLSGSSAASQVQSLNGGAGPFVTPGSSPGSAASNRSPLSPNRRTRGENKKCRKVYGMDHKEQWCTQCKWKKACSRFGD